MQETGVHNGAYGADKFGLKNLKGVNWNFGAPQLYEHALKNSEAVLSADGALVADTGVFTGLALKGPEGQLGYDFQNLVVEHAMRNSHVPVGFWRGVNANQNAYWLEFPYEDVDVLKGPVADDRYERYYWTSVGTGPQYNPLLRIIQGYAPLTLGVPYPTTFPGVVVGPAPVEGTIYLSLNAFELPDNSSAATPSETPTILARSYVYTYVTDYGEESAPSSPGPVSWWKTPRRASYRSRSEERRVGKECRSRWSPYH